MKERHVLLWDVSGCEEIFPEYLTKEWDEKWGVPRLRCHVVPDCLAVLDALRRDPWDLVWAYAWRERNHFEGLKLCNAIRCDPYLRHIPVFLHSGMFLHGTETYLSGARLGLMRPYSWEVLWAALAHVLPGTRPSPSAAAALIEELAGCALPRETDEHPGVSKNLGHQIGWFFFGLDVMAGLMGKERMEHGPIDDLVALLPRDLASRVRATLRAVRGRSNTLDPGAALDIPEPLDELMHALAAWCLESGPGIA